jgi:hypothetical protein
MAPQASVPPEHVCVQSPPLHVIAPHAALPVHARVQVPVVHDCVPHTGSPSPPPHVDVQLPLVQLMSPHAALPLQVTSQFFVAHVMPRQALSAVQSISHDAALLQLIVPHAPGVAQPMLQFQAVGQLMLPPPVPVIVHVVVVKSQPPLHVSGHTAASSSRASGGCTPTMQYPPSQIRPG